MSSNFLILSILLGSWLLVGYPHRCTMTRLPPPTTVHIVKGGTGLKYKSIGKEWTAGPGYLECSGLYHILYAHCFVENADFHLEARLRLDTIGESTALLWLFDNHFGFDSTPTEVEDTENRFFFYSPVIDSVIHFDKTLTHIKPKEIFQIDLYRRNSHFQFLINGQEIAYLPDSIFKQPMQGVVGFRPWRNTLRIYDFSITGAISDFPKFDYAFSRQEGGYSCFRLPGLIQTNAGTILAFAEGRKNSCYDGGDIDLVVRRSLDGGRTWGPVITIWSDGENSCGYPAPLIDRHTGRIHLISTWGAPGDHLAKISKGEGENIRRIFHLYSDDDGKQWSAPKEITEMVKPQDWTWYSTGSGSGIQLRNQPYEGRLLVGSSHMKAGQEAFFSHAIYSDDGGRSWQIGGIAPLEGVNECEIAELSDGRLLLNMRNYRRQVPARQVAYSDDGGLSWRDQHHDSTLIEPICQASLQNGRTVDGQEFLLFANPAHPYSRENMTVRVSFDGGDSWPRQLQLYRGQSAYSDLIVLQDGQLGCLYECGDVWPYTGLMFSRFDLKDLK